MHFIEYYGICYFVSHENNKVGHSESLNNIFDF